MHTRQVHTRITFDEFSLENMNLTMGGTPYFLNSYITLGFFFIKLTSVSKILQVFSKVLLPTRSPSQIFIRPSGGMS